jgi:hypothetical protein
MNKIYPISDKSKAEMLDYANYLLVSRPLLKRMVLSISFPEIFSTEHTVFRTTTKDDFHFETYIGDMDEEILHILVNNHIRELEYAYAAWLDR